MRDERERQAAAARRIEAAGLVAPRGSDRFVGQVTTGGTLPTCVPCVYILNPVQLGGSETEGGAGSNAVDSTRQIPVVVLGHAPSIGDKLIAHSAGGRWVAERGGAPPAHCGSACFVCGGIYITGGTITDAQGTHAIDPVTKQTDVICYPVPSCVDCQAGCTPTTGSGAYWYTIGCADDHLIVSQHMYGYFIRATTTQCVPSCCATLTANLNPCGSGDCNVATRSFSVPVTCGDDTVTASGTTTWPPLTGNSVAGDIGFTNGPETAFSVSLDIEKPGTGPCVCGPSCAQCGGFNIGGDVAVQVNNAYGVTASFSEPQGTLLFIKQIFGCCDHGDGSGFQYPLPYIFAQVACTFIQFWLEIPPAGTPIPMTVTYDSLTVDCNADTVVFTWTGITISFHCPPTMGVPDGCEGTCDSIVATFPIENREHRTCCSPCGIPQKDLTLTIGATTTTLAYNAVAGTWSDGTHSLSCADGPIGLFGGGTWDLDPSSITCDPLHLVFTSGATTAYVDEP